MANKAFDSRDSILENPIYGRIFRSLTTPLTLLLSTYAVSIIGFMLIPGIDDSGDVYRMRFFEALYFVSFMGSTIGFGELPYPFTDGQRVWTLICIYMTVISWLYSITYLIALLLEDDSQRAIKTRKFVRKVRAIKEPFFLICGVDDTGITVAEALHAHGIRTVGIDIREDSADTRRRANLRLQTPIIQDDAGKASVLKAAGLKHSKCLGVLALSPSDSTNLKIAITTRILNPRMPVYSRAETEAAAKNMASFETTHIFNAYEDFGHSFDLAFESPHLHALRRLVTMNPRVRTPEIRRPPVGRWIVCGYGRFGKAVCETLTARGCEAVVIETDFVSTNAPENSILDTGTEENTLREAGITESVGIVAGTDDDTNNLSIAITAANIIPDLFLVIRQNQNENEEIFNLAPHNLNVQNSSTIAARILETAITPLAREFIELALRETDEWAEQLLAQIEQTFDRHVPQFWSIKIDLDRIQAIPSAPQHILLSDLLASGSAGVHPFSRQKTVPRSEEDDYIVLFRHRRAERILLPSTNSIIEHDDEYFVCGRSAARDRMRDHLSQHSRSRFEQENWHSLLVPIFRKLDALKNWITGFFR